jgi:hypothetical protein
MGIPPASGPERADPAAKAEPAGRGLPAVLDIVGLLILGWMLGLWQLGTPGVPTLLRMPTFPGFAQLSVRDALSLTLLAVTILLAVVVLASFARSPGRLRWLGATPLLVVLLGLAIWRFVVGFVLVADQYQTFGYDPQNAGFWDAPAVTLGFTGTVLLILRPSRLARTTRALVTTAVMVSVSATLIPDVLDFADLFGIGYLGSDLFIHDSPALILPLVGAAMAPVWLRSLHRGKPAAAAGLLLWGLVVAAAQVIPFFLISVLRTDSTMSQLESFGSGTISGLDCLVGMLAVAAAVLTAPVIQDYRIRDQHERRAVLRGPLAMLSILLIADATAQFVVMVYRMLFGLHRFLGEVDPPPVENLIDGLALIGALLIGLVAIWPQPRWAPFTLAGAVFLLAVPVVVFRAPETYSWWDGEMLAQTFTLPLALLALLVAARRWASEPASVSSS